MYVRPVGVAHGRGRYRINGKSYTQEAKTSPWSIVQQQSGEFIVSSVAHQQRMCKAVVANLRMHIHPLPSAQVGHGKRIYQDIREGMVCLPGVRWDVITFTRR